MAHCVGAQDTQGYADRYAKADLLAQRHENDCSRQRAEVLRVTLLLRNNTEQ